MGTRGPAPKRSDQRRRANAPAQPLKKPAKAGTVKIPPASSTWHRGARQWYAALRDLAGPLEYTSADWATAWNAADALSREMNPRPVTLGRGDDAHTVMLELPITAAAMQAFLKACTALLATEGDRRRAQIELQPPKPPGGDGEGSGGNVSWLDDARQRFSGTG